MLYLILAIWEFLRDIFITMFICVFCGVAAYIFVKQHLAPDYPILLNPVYAAAIGAGAGGFVNVPITWLVKGKKKIKNLDE